MKRLGRYLTLWWTLPPAERRMRAGRKVERLLRRSPLCRRIGLSPDQPRWRSLRRALGVDLDTLVRRLKQGDPARGPLHRELSARVAFLVEHHTEHAEAMLRQASDLLDRRFDLLGSGPSRPVRADGGIDWHRDFKSGRDWDPRSYHLDLETVRGDGSDVKLPWELSRFQHLLVLGQAYHFAPRLLPEDDAERLRRDCAREALAQIEDWIDRNRPGFGVNWTCTMDVAIRSVNWLAALALFREAPELDLRFLRIFVRALWTHGRHIRRNLEIGDDGLTSNHYLSDVVGLYALGCALPEFRESDDWRSTGRAALIREIDRQVLPDGVDFERSIPYHRLVTEIFVHGALYAVASGEAMPDRYLERLSAMLEFTSTCTRPDGTVPQWGDNDDGRLLPLDGYASPRPHDHRHVVALGGRLLARPDLVAASGGQDVEARWLLDPGTEPAVSPAGLRSRAFPSSGYHVMRDADLHLGVSCGPVGTAGIGNHSHNDLFAPCVWAGGREWVPDPGTGSYTAEPETRNRLRSTAAHATLQLGDREQNSFDRGVSSLFLMRGTAEPKVLEWRADDEGASLSAVHRGFSDPQAIWTHQRQIRFEARRRLWSIVDELSCVGGEEVVHPGGEPVRLRFPLAPDVIARERSERDWPEPVTRQLGRAAITTITATGRRERNAFELVAGADRFWFAFDLPPGSSLETRDAVVSPRYGVTLLARVLVVTMPLAPLVRAVTILHSPDAGWRP